MMITFMSGFFIGALAGIFTLGFLVASREENKDSGRGRPEPSVRI